MTDKLTFFLFEEQMILRSIQKKISSCSRWLSSMVHWLGSFEAHFPLSETKQEITHSVIRKSGKQQ